MEIIVKKPSNEELNQMNFSKWGTWECGVSVFPWTYDAKETCYVLDGQVVVETDTQKVEFKKGDLVVFPKGLNCRWTVIKPVRKYYVFD